MKNGHSLLSGFLFSLIFVLSQIASIPICAQNYTFSGQVKDEQGNLLPNMMLTVYSLVDTNQLLTYGKSNIRGDFNLSCRDSIVLMKIKSIEYQPFREILQSKQQNFNIILKNRVYELDELIVKLNKGFATLKKDTIDYDLSKLHLKQNDNLMQILKNIPGFKVDGNAKITHNGVEINKMLINGKEVFIYQNKIALSSVENNMLDGLSVINNYQDPFKLSLNGENEEKVIDLKVKKSFVNIIKGRVELGGGYADKYKIKPFLFYFGQSLSVFSLHNLNNTFDKDLSSEDYSRSREARNSSSVYFNEQYNNLFFAKDISLNKEKVFSNSITLRHTGDKLSLQTVWDYTALSTKRILESYARLYTLPMYRKTGNDSTHNYFLNGFLNLRYKVRKNMILGYSISLYNDAHRLEQDLHTSNFIEHTEAHILERINSNSRIVANNLSFETQLFKSWSLSNYLKLKYEEAVDNYRFNGLNIQSPFEEGVTQNINLKSNQSTFHSELKYQYDKFSFIGLSAVLEKEHHRLNNANIFEEVNNTKRKLLTGLNAQIRLQKLRLESSLEYNIENRKTQSLSRRYEYFTWNLNAIYFLDLYNKNRLTLNYQRAFKPMDIKAGLYKRIVSFDHLVLGKPELLNDIFKINRATLSYRYLSPISGTVFGLNVGLNTSPLTIVQAITSNTIDERQLLKVKGYKLYNIGVEYGQYFLKNLYPVNANFSADYFSSTSHQVDLNTELSIKQLNSELKLNLSSFSKNMLNFNFYLNWQKNHVKYSNQQESLQNTYSLALGPKLQWAKKWEINPLLKVLKTKNELINSNFLDVDLKTSFQLNEKYTFSLTGENMLNAFDISNKASLPDMTQSGGINYYTGYKNTLGYLLLEFAFRF